MIRTITVLSAILLATCSIAHAEDRGASLPKLGFEPHQYQQWHSVDANLSLQEYEEIYNRNRKLSLKILKSYTKDTLGSVGISGQSFNLMGAAIGLVVDKAKLNLNKSKTLALEFDDMDEPDRALYFRFELNW